MKKQDGFPGQQSYVIPERLVNFLKESVLCSDLYLTDIGYYPQARNHYRERPHGSNQNILIYNIGGNGSIYLGERELVLPTDHFVIIPERVAHAYSAHQHNPWSIYWIHFGGTKARHLAKPALQPIPVSRSNTSRINERLDLFKEIFAILERGFTTETLEYTSLCLPRLLASFTYLTQYRSINEQNSKDTIAMAISLMLENTDRKLSLKELAQNVKLSPSHFSRLFQNQTGHSPIDYFIQLKIQRSCRLLDNPNLTIAEVARATGFEDQFYFSRQFRKTMNMSPLKYRKR